MGKTSLITRFMYDSFDNTYQVSILNDNNPAHTVIVKYPLQVFITNKIGQQSATVKEKHTLSMMIYDI